MWLETARAKAWVAQNPTVGHWLDRLSSPETRNVFGQAFEAFCISTGKTPAELLEMRREDLKDPNDGYRTLEIVQNFILHGQYADRRKGREGKIIKVGESSRTRRENYLSAIKSYFAHNRAQLPEDRAFRIRDTDNIATHETYMSLENARAIIACLKQPYKTLATASLYSGMGRKEALSLNRLWKTQITPQLEANKDPIRIDFMKRKSNDRPYFTLLPATLLRPFLGKDLPFAIFSKHSKTKVLRPVNESDLLVAWSYAKKRAGVQGKQTFHMLRDLLITTFYHIGADVISGQFLTGHGVDPNNYLQITKSPERALKEWAKYRQFLDTGMDSEAKEQVEKLRKQMLDDHRRLETVEAQNARLLKENEALQESINAAEDRMNEMHSKQSVDSMLAERDNRLEFLEHEIAQFPGISQREAFAHNDPKWQKEFEKRLRRYKALREGTVLKKSNDQ